MKLSLIEELVDLVAQRRPAALVTDLQSGEQYTATLQTAPHAIAEAITLDRSGEIESEGRKYFVLVRNPSPRIIIVGAVHITQALAPMATMCGYEVIVVDPRRAFASRERFPNITLCHDWPDEALHALKVDMHTAIVTLSHDPKLDDPALMIAVRSPAFYIGSLGSKKTHIGRVARLKEKGYSDDEISRVHGPVGLDIGAKSPSEIAISILAQLTAARHGKLTQNNAHIFGMERVDTQISHEAFPYEAKSESSSSGLKIAAVILAAGQSSRMGRNKLLLDWHGKPILSHVLDQVAKVSFAEMVLVTGHQADKIKAAIGKRPDLTIIEAPEYMAGMAASLKAGIKALSTSSDAALFILGDMPQISSQLLKSLIDAYKPSEGATIVLPVADGKRGNPVLFDQQFFTEILQLEGDIGARHIIADHAQSVAEVPGVAQEIFSDVDTSEAYQKLLASSM